MKEEKKKEEVGVPVVRAVLFALTLFVSAALLFAVQPMAGKMVLPLLGGTPAVWNTCMVFFQAILLAGYLYAHGAVARLGVGRQTRWHLLLLAVPVAAFAAAVALAGTPVPLAEGLLPVGHDYPVAPLLAVLAVAVGLPFLVLSTTAPLLQRWYAEAGSRRAYALYAASNAGSLLGLLGYPLLIEPWLTLEQQRWLWAGGVGLCLVLVAVCALATPRGAGGADTDADPPTSRAEVLRWVALAALPSAMLLAVTTVLTSDVAPVPLLWVVPLALYLLSFILVFAWWPDGVHQVVARVNLMLLVFVGLVLATNSTEPLLLVGALHLAAFFGTALVCHGELVRRRPPGERLTAFYLSLSAGGVLGGLACALAAPLLFCRLGLIEYPLCIFLAALVRPPELRDGRTLFSFGGRWLDFVGPAVLGLTTAGLIVVVRAWMGPALPQSEPDFVIDRTVRVGLCFGLPAVCAFVLVSRPVGFALALAALWLAGAADIDRTGRVLRTERNFFGTLRVSLSQDGKFVRLTHGTTQHGQQRVGEEGPPTPLLYYHPTGPVGSIFRALAPEWMALSRAGWAWAGPRRTPAECALAVWAATRPVRPFRVGVVGLGTGAMAAYARPGHNWTFFEIDPAVVRIARDTGHFSFLAHCQAPYEIVLGDARLQLQAREDAFDVLLVDAFSSDAIPVHLLTREALALYVRRLAPGGVLAIHVSNRYLDLDPLVARLAALHEPAPLAVRVDHDLATEPQQQAGKSGSSWMVLARTDADLRRLGRHPRWQKVERKDGPVWTDSFSNLIGVWKREKE